MRTNEARLSWRRVILKDVMIDARTEGQVDWDISGQFVTMFWCIVSGNNSISDCDSLHVEGGVICEDKLHELIRFRLRAYSRTSRPILYCNTPCFELYFVCARLDAKVLSADWTTLESILPATLVTTAAA